MEKLYQINPIEKKSIEYFISMYQETPEGENKTFEATFQYRWGQGFRNIEEPPTEYEIATSISCDPQLGNGTELEDLIAVEINFDGEWEEQEMETIRAYCEGEYEDKDGLYGESWLLAGEHEYEIEIDNINIFKPFKIKPIEIE